MPRQLETRFMAKGARRCAVLLAKDAAEMRRIVEAPAKADVGNGDFLVQRVDQFGTTAFEPARAQIRRKILPDSLEQFLQITRRDAFIFRDQREADFGVAQTRLDCA